MNTRSKRASSVQMLMPFVIAPPPPDGTIDQGDRQHIAWSYSGILAIEVLYLEQGFILYIVETSSVDLGVVQEESMDLSVVQEENVDLGVVQEESMDLNVVDQLDIDLYM